MKPYLHAKSSARKFGGVPDDYVEIHDFMDYSKAYNADVKHRIALHHAMGCWVVEEKFGHIMENSAGKEFSPRDVAEQHCLEDHGRILSFRHWMRALPIPDTFQDGIMKVASRTNRRDSFYSVLMRPHDHYDEAAASLVYHNDFGIWLVRSLQGDDAAQEAKEWICQCFGGSIPSFEDLVQGLTIQPWMGPPKSTRP